jgi:hypothetical protein
MGLLAGLLLGVFVGSAPDHADGAGGDPGVAVAPAGVPGSVFWLMASDLPSWSSALTWFEETGDDDEGTRESDRFLMLPPTGRAPRTVGTAGPFDRGGAFDAARVSRCPLFLLVSRLVC